MSCVIGKLCTVIAIVSTTLGMRMMVRWYFTERKKVLSWKPVGRVTQLAIFPLTQGERVNLPKVRCTKHGLRSPLNENLQDRCFVIYEDGNAKLFHDESCYFDTIRVDCKLNEFVLETPKKESLSIPFNQLNEVFTMVAVHIGEVIPVRDCGDDAADWVSHVLVNGTKKLRLGYYNMDFKKDPSLTEWYETFLSSVELFTRNGLIFHSGLTNPLLINEDSIDGVATAMETFLNPYDFNANIVIRYSGGHPLEEYTWKKVKIGGVVFDCTKSCKDCLISRGSLYGNRSNYQVNMQRFMLVMKNALRKYVDFKVKDTPFIGIALKLAGCEGDITLNSEVFALC